MPLSPKTTPLLPAERTLALVLAALLGLAFWFAVAYPLTPQRLTPWLAHLGLSAQVGSNQFVDQRTFWGIPHTMDVLSNLPFLLFGMMGLFRLRQQPKPHGQEEPLRKMPARLRLAHAVFFAGLVFTALGSGLYHYSPNDETLLWDRAGMAFAFAGIVGLATFERISPRSSPWVVFTVLLFAAAALVDWAYAQNVGPWSVVQFGGMGLVLWLAFRARPQHLHATGVSLGWIVALYALAKMAESLDQVIFHATMNTLSGHSLKHVLASLAAWPVLASLEPPARREHPEHASQFTLLTQRRFAPFFWTQFMGAMNDNVFKFALTLMVTYQLNLHWLNAAQAGLVIGAVFIFPFLLASATCGQITDKWEKTRVIKLVKNLEIAIMALAAYGFWRSDDGGVALLLLCVGLMGLHSTLFGPVKYALLPQVLNEREITGGNGMIEMGTFVAILLGNLLGGLLVVIPHSGHGAIALTCFLLALIGRALAQFIPRAPATDPHLQINWNPLSETWRNLQLARENRVVFRSLLGISWMWFVGAVFLSQFPSFAKDVLHGQTPVASLLLVVFSLGIGVGSLLCEGLSRRHVEIGLVPLGAIGISVFALDLYLASRSLGTHAPMGLREFLAQREHWRVLLDLGMLAFCAGLYSVPMYALVQIRSPKTHRARIIAANNVLNALFMVVSALLAGGLLFAGATIPEVFLALALSNVVVAGYIFLLVPEYLLRFVAWLISHLMYRFEVQGDEHLPTQGAAVLTCNHVSFIDAVLILAASPRPVRFLMDYRIFQIPVLGWFFKLAKAIPIAPKAENEALYNAAFEAAHQALLQDDFLCIFPEGAITKDGQIQPFKNGVTKLLNRAWAEGMPVPVIPMALTNLWGSFFSRKGGAAMTHPFRRGLFNRVGLRIAAAIPAMPSADLATLERLQTATQQLLGDLHQRARSKA